MPWVADHENRIYSTNTVCDGVSSITNHPSVAPYLQSASDKASTVTANASDLSSKATDSNNLPSRDQISEAAKGAAGSASAYASSAATVATEGVQNVGAKVGLTSSATAPNAPSFEASQGASTHEDVLQPGSAEYGAGTQGSTKPDSTVA